MKPSVFLRKYGRILLGGGVLALILLATLAAPLITPYQPTAVSPAEGMQFPSAVHWMGTDRFGRDISPGSSTGPGSPCWWAWRWPPCPRPQASCWAC